MGTFLTALPVNYGFYNLTSVQTYPTGGTGPTAYGPTSYFGSDPLPPRTGDSVNNPVDLGDLTSVFKSVTLSNTHGGNTRTQSTFYKFFLTKPRSIQITQNYSQTSYQSNTNRNTIISIYVIENGTQKRELPINDSGYVYKQTGITEDDSFTNVYSQNDDYPNAPLDAGTYIVLITNDIRYLETTYSFTLNPSLVDWRFVREIVDDSYNFGLIPYFATYNYGLVSDPLITTINNYRGVLEAIDIRLDYGLVNQGLDLITEPVTEVIDFGSLAVVTANSSAYRYSTTSGLGYTRSGVSP